MGRAAMLMRIWGLLAAFALSPGCGAGNRDGTVCRGAGLPRCHGPYRIGPVALPALVQLARLERVLFPQPLSLAALAGLWLARESCFLAAYQGPQVAAYIGFRRWGPAARTISMGVHPAHRRRGLGTAIQEAADGLAAAAGARWFQGEVRISNRPQLLLLEGMGWQRVGVCSRFFTDGEDAVVVWKWL